MTKSKKTETRPLEYKPHVSLAELMKRAALNSKDPEILTSLANRLIRLSNKMKPEELKEFKNKAGISINSVAENLLSAFDEDVIAERAGVTLDAEQEPTPEEQEELDAAREELIKEAEITTEIMDPADDAAGEWYKSVLEDDTYRQQYSHYVLADINLDGVDELFLSTTADYFITDEDKACLLTYDNGEVKTLQEIGGKAGEYWHVNQSDATLTYFSRMSGEGDLTLYKLEGGELREVATANYYAQHHYPERDTDEEIYLMDGKESSKEEYESFWEQYGSESGALIYDNEL